MYPEELVRPMRAELTQHGFQELKNKDEVDQAFSDQKGVAVLVVNSVCGCAAGAARPCVVMSLDGESKPDHLLTVFAGQDAEATAKAREYLMPYPPSSPAIGLFKDGELVHMIERHHIEGRSAQLIAEHLKMAYNEMAQ